MIPLLLKSKKFLAAVATLFVSTCLVLSGIALPAAGFFWFAVLYLLWRDAVQFDQAIPALKKPTPILFFLATGMVVLTRLLNFDAINLHRDEFIEAYFSQALGLITTDFFAPVPNPPSWVAQFPAFFFFLQKIALTLFGQGVFAVKISTLPFVLVECWGLFRLGKRLLGERYATIPIWLFALFSPAMYFESFATHIQASNAFFILFLSFFIEALELNSFSAAWRAGLLLCICLLNYPSSYLAFPVAALLTLSSLIVQRSWAALRVAMMCGAACLLLMAPFAADWVKHGFYLGARIEQVNLVQGSWSEEAKRIESGDSTLSVIGENLGQAVQALVQSNIGGAEDYNFGRQNLLTSTNCSLLMLAIVLMLQIGWRDLAVWGVVGSMLLAFVIGMGLTKPPPAFHRFTIGFPLICLMLSYSIRSPLLLNKAPNYLRYALFTILCSLFCLSNIKHFMQMRIADQEHGFDIADDIKVITFIDQHLPAGIPVTIAAYPTLALEFIFPFFSSQRPVVTRYHRDVLNELDRSKPYIVAVLCFDGFCDTFGAADPAGRVIDIGSQRFKIFTNVQNK